MSSLYPSTLFHFTKKRWLYKILKENFKVSYAREKIVGINSEISFAVPMVSFCDIKLAEIKHFIEKEYGYFGIGLTKDWANRNGLNPVMYLNRHSELTDHLLEGIKGLHKEIFKSINPHKCGPWEDQRIVNYVKIWNTYRYVKNYEGVLIRKGKLIDSNYRFADEREWRFVPSYSIDEIEPLIKDISKISTKKQKDEYNKRISHIKLNFQPDDIKYLIVEKESDISELINHLDYAKSRFDSEIRRKLASRILTVEQIKNDI